MTDSWLHKMNHPIKRNESVFEIGCWVGAVLTHISNTILPDKSIILGESDFSPNAIQAIKDVFKSDNFYCLNMIDTHPISDNSIDHVHFILKNVLVH